MQDNPYTRIVAKLARALRLFAVHWELTYRCNATCAHCYLDVLPPHADPGELTTAEANHLLDQIAALGALHVTFSGGEILVRRDFFEIAEHARRKRLAVRLMTNGILITPPVADRIAALHPTAVEISLYGADAATHDAITRHPRSFELTLRAFHLLRARGVRLVMKTPLMRENIRQLHALRERATDAGAIFQSDATITAKDTGDATPLKHRLTYADLVEFLRAEINAHDPASRGESARACGIGLSSMMIDPYGNVFPCVQTRISAGNVRTQSLKKIWGASPVLREMRALTWSALPICRACKLKPLCPRCHGIARAESGDLRAPAAINCRAALARRQVLIEKEMLPPDVPIPAHLKEEKF
ncbi:MAG: radical SAM protein [Chloroflexi bacterium]|nr:radical SAM protein [Chloroflexota bacterium]